MVHSRRFRLAKEVLGADDACKDRGKIHNLNCGLIEIIQMGFEDLFVRERTKLMNL